MNPSPSIRLKVSEVTGSKICVSSAHGSLLYEKIKEVWSTGRTVVLDFAGVDLLISAFLNAAVGRLVEGSTAAAVRERLRFENLVEEDAELIQHVLENAEAFYADPERFERALKGDGDETGEDEK